MNKRKANEIQDVLKKSMNQLHRMNKTNRTPWSAEMVARFNAMESGLSETIDLDELAGKLTDIFVAGLKKRELPNPHERNWYLMRIREVLLRNGHSLATILSVSTLLDNFNDPGNELNSMARL